MSLGSNTLLRAAIGAVVLPLVLVGAVYLALETAGGIAFAPELALIMLAETAFLVVLVQWMLIRMRKTSRIWYACAYGVPFAVGGYWFSDGTGGEAMPLIAVLALTGGIGAALGLAQWMIVVWRNEALRVADENRPAV